ncbi:hypothetical protein BGW39_001383 [Mortierella sp. 14UC]|nr:hypothetical protein BGW39_001383 [Mortierella sp. 14UC]
MSMPNAIHIHHPQRDPSISTIDDDYYDDKDWFLEQPNQEPLQGQGPTAQDEDSNDDDVSVFVAARSTAKTEIAASTLASLLMETQTQTQTQAKVPAVAFPLPFPEASSVPVKFVSAQGPRRGPQLRDQPASWMCRAAPISGTGTSPSADFEAILFSSSCPFPRDVSLLQGERRDNIFSRRFSDKYQEQRFSFPGHPPHPHLLGHDSQLLLDQDRDKDEQKDDPCGLILSHQHDCSHDNNSENQHPHLQQQQGQTRHWSVLPQELGLEAALGECLGDTTYFSPVSAHSVTSKSSSSSSTTTSQDDEDKDVGQHPHHQDDEQDAAIPSPPLPSPCAQQDEPDHRRPLRSPMLVKNVVATTIVTTAFADAVLDLNRDPQAASPLQHLYQFQRVLSPPQVTATVFSDRLPPTSPPSSSLQVPVPSSAPLPDDRDDDQESIVTLPAPVAFVVPDIKDNIYEQGPVGLNSPPLPIILLPGRPQEDATKQQDTTSTSTAKADARFLNGWLAETFSWWTKPAPVSVSTPAPVVVPSLVITPAPMADA